MNTKTKIFLSTSVLVVVLVIILVLVFVTKANSNPVDNTDNEEYKPYNQSSEPDDQSETDNNTDATQNDFSTITQNDVSDYTDLVPGFCNVSSYLKQGAGWVKDNSSTDTAPTNACYKNGNVSVGDTSQEKQWTCPVGMSYALNNSTLEEWCVT